RVCQAEVASLWGGSVTVALGGRRVFPGFVGRSDPRARTVVWWSGSDSVVVASLREVAIVLFAAIAPNTFLRELPPTIAVSGSAGAPGGGEGGFCLVRSPPCPAPPNKSCVLRPGALGGRGRRIQDTSRVGPNGRDLGLPLGSSDRTTGPQRGPFRLLSVLSGST